MIRDSLLKLAAREENIRKKAGLALVRDDFGDPVMGNPNGKITVYEFSDYNCSYCKRIFTSLQTIISNHSDVRLVIKEFPILSQSSVLAAKAGIAVAIQNKFNDFHIAMMTHRGKITEDVVMGFAKQTGANYERLITDMNSPKTIEILERTRKAASALGINGTPALVIGKNVVSGAVGIEEIMQLITDENDKNS